MKKFLMVLILAGMTVSAAACGDSDVTPVREDTSVVSEEKDKKTDADVQDTSVIQEEDGDNIDSTGNGELPTLDPILGTWYETDDLFSRTLVIKEDGSVEIYYEGGGITFGTIKVEAEEHPDGDDTYWYNIYDEAGDFVEGFSVDTEAASLEELYGGQDGSTHFIRGGVGSPQFDMIVNTDENISVVDYPGTYVCDRCSIDVIPENDANNTFTVNISWANSAYETFEWSYICHYDEDVRALTCEFGGTKVDLTTSDDGVSDANVLYTNGQAAFSIEDGFLRWYDLNEQEGDGMEFEYMP
jgi:hypothetical protein